MAAVGSAKMQLYIRCENLADMDTLSKSDPYAVVYYSKDGGGQLTAEVGRTELISNNLNPNFLRGISVDYLFEQKQVFVIKVFDDDGKGDAGNDLLGTATFQLAHVVGSRGSTLALDLKPGKAFITAKETSKAGRDTISFSFVGKALKKMDWFGKSDPYFKIQRILPNKTLKLIFQSKHIDNTLDPQWQPTPLMQVGELTTADMNEPTIRFECFDKDMFSDDDMGWFDCSLNDLINAKAAHTQFELRDAKNLSYGHILVADFKLNHVPTFVEMMGLGLQINLAVSIDFTGSNGDPRNARSLHFMDPVKPNQYVRAIMSVGDILLQYDSDKQVPAFGFGAQLPDGQVSHFFHLNFQPNPHVFGVQGLLDAYGRALGQVRLAGPTNFAPTIASVRQNALQSPGAYTILLILTDGEITDMDATVREIVGCDRIPMSIIIVGVGNGCDFEMMSVLDGDDQKLRSGHLQMTRDIVQFVPFRNFENAPPGALASEVLKEVPDQVVDWAVTAGWKPLPMPAGPVPAPAGPPPPQGPPAAGATSFEC